VILVGSPLSPTHSTASVDLAVPSLGDSSIGWRMKDASLRVIGQFFLLPIQKAYGTADKIKSSFD
jgi:hypothetical protein